MTFYFFILLIIVLSMDAFAAGLSYGVGKVHVPLPSLMIASLLSGGILTLSLLAGNFILHLIPALLTKGLLFTVLLLLSLYKFYDTIPQLHRKEDSLTTNIISQKINKENKEILSCHEAVFLALALSVDNVSAGLCTGYLPLPAAILLILTSLVHLIFMRVGHFAGIILSGKSSHNFAWLGAAILMVLAFIRLL